jgi:hypothetical protein
LKSVKNFLGKSQLVALRRSPAISRSVNRPRINFSGDQFDPLFEKFIERTRKWITREILVLGLRCLILVAHFAWGWVTLFRKHESKRHR